MPLFFAIWYELFQSSYFWEELFLACQKFTIKIIANNSSSVVSHENSVRIQHWDNFQRNITFVYPMNNFTRLHYLLQKTIKNPWTRSFSRMCSGINYNKPSSIIWLFFFLWILERRGIIGTSYCTIFLLFLQYVFCWGFTFNSYQWNFQTACTFC